MDVDALAGILPILCSDIIIILALPLHYTDTDELGVLLSTITERKVRGRYHLIYTLWLNSLKLLRSVLNI